MFLSVDDKLLMGRFLMIDLVFDCDENCQIQAIMTKVRTTFQLNKCVITV